jgi:hypothetical protein
MKFNSAVVDEILDNIFPLPSCFGVQLDNPMGDDEPVGFSDIQEIVGMIDPDANIYYGMSKLVIISPRVGNVVIKIPFNGFFTYYNSIEQWVPFTWATGTDSSDYCLAEYEKYERLKTYELECFVAKTMFYKKICGVRVFLQERVMTTLDSWKSPQPSQRSSKIADQWYNEGKFYIDPEWIANCLDFYGQSKVKRFLHYCSNIDLDILADVHSGNFGYRNGETPVIIDYSNFSD